MGVLWGKLMGIMGETTIIYIYIYMIYMRSGRIAPLGFHDETIPQGRWSAGLLRPIACPAYRPGRRPIASARLGSARAWWLASELIFRKVPAPAEVAEGISVEK